MKKKLLSIILAGSFLIPTFCFSTGVQAASSPKDSKPKVEKLSKAEYCARLAKLQGITLEDATKIVDDRNTNKTDNQSKDFYSLVKQQLTAGEQVSYQQISWEDSIANSDGIVCDVHDGFLATLQGSNYFYYIAKVEQPYVIPSGSADFSWVSGNAAATVINNGGGASFSAAGTIQATTPKSFTAGYQRAGFSVSGTTGGNAVVRKAITLSHTYTL